MTPALPASALLARARRAPLLRGFKALRRLEIDTLPETNIAPENWWLEDEFPFRMTYFQGRTVNFRECRNSENPTIWQVDFKISTPVGATSSAHPPMT